MVVEKDPFKGRRLCDEDLARLAKLTCFKKDPFPQKATCAICECHSAVQSLPICCGRNMHKGDDINSLQI